MAVKRTFTALPDEIDYARMNAKGGHWTVLHIIGRHYKLGHGPKTAMTQQLIATTAGLHRVTVAAILRDLRAWDYVEALRDPQDGRKRIYRPIYGNADNDAGGDDKPATNGIMSISTTDHRVIVWGTYSDAELKAKAKWYSKDTPYTRQRMQQEDPGLLSFMRLNGYLPTLN